MLCRFLNQKELQQNQIKDKQLPPQFVFSKLTHENQIKPVHDLVKQVTVLPSQKDDCLSILADSGKNNSQS